jgi:hypothetical protein
MLEKLSADVRAVVTSPAFAERTRALGINAWGRRRRSSMRGSRAKPKWAEIARAANLKPSE